MITVYSGVKMWLQIEEKIYFKKKTPAQIIIVWRPYLFESEFTDRYRAPTRAGDERENSNKFKSYQSDKLSSGTQMQLWKETFDVVFKLWTVV